MWWGGSRAESDSATGSHTQKLGTTARKHIGSLKLSEYNYENPTTASYLAPKVGKLWRCGTGGCSEKTNGCGERRALTAVKVFAHSLTVFGLRWCMCADGRTPNPHCHLLFPAKHLVTDQDNLVWRPKSLTSCTGVFPQQTSQYISHLCNTQSHLKTKNRENIAFLSATSKQP